MKIQSKPSFSFLGMLIGLFFLSHSLQAQISSGVVTPPLWSANGTHISNSNSGGVGIGQTQPRSKLHVQGAIESSGAEVTTFGNLPIGSLVSSNIYRSYRGATYLDGASNQIDAYIQYRSVYGGYADYTGNGYGFWSQGANPRMFMEVISGNHGNHKAKLPADSPIEDGYLYQQIQGPAGQSLPAPMKATRQNSLWLWGVKSLALKGGSKASLEVNGRLEAEDLRLDGAVITGVQDRLGIGTSTPTAKLHLKDDQQDIQLSLQGQHSRGGSKFGQYGFLQCHIDNQNNDDRILIGSGVRYDDLSHRYDASSNQQWDRSAIEFLNGGHIAFYGQHGNISNDPYFTTNEWHNLEHMRITAQGKVGIGTTNPDAELVVKGTVKAREIVVEADAGADFVFEEDYELMPLAELEAHVKTHKHLPEIAPAAEMVENGVPVAEFQIQLLQKVEELSLYVIDLDKQVKALERENADLRDQLDYKR